MSRNVPSPEGSDDLNPIVDNFQVFMLFIKLLINLIVMTKKCNGIDIMLCE